MNGRLIFVYNADSGFFNALGDLAHKLFSPQTYQCNLCALTHSATGMRAEWRSFLQGLPVELEFLHREEWRGLHADGQDELPAIFLQATDGSLDVLVGAEELNGIEKLNTLMSRITERLAGLTGC